MFQFNMKTLIITIPILLLGTVFIVDSYAQENVDNPTSEPTLPEVSLQLTIRNSEGQLIAYVEPTIMIILNLEATHRYLDLIPNKTAITKDGEIFEVIQFSIEQTFFGSAQYATFGIFFENKFVLVFRHDAYLSHPGDVVTGNWYIIRTGNT